MSTKARITKLESVKRDNGVKRIFVYYEGDDTGRLDGVQMSRAEFEKIRTDADAVLVVRRASGATKNIGSDVSILHGKG